jgi:heptosyltransferase-1
MKILLIKLSSLGDTIHTLPSISDIHAQIPQAEISWAIEPAFADIAHMHPHVKQVLPIPLRQAKQWRQTPRLLPHIYQTIRAQSYDHIIDAQGLLKSGVLSQLARGQNSGYDRLSAREPLASYCYKKAYTVTKDLHAIMRTKSLCAQALQYTMPPRLDFAIGTHNPHTLTEQSPILLFHGTTWDSKHYPETHWQQLINLITQAGYPVALPWGNAAEYARAQRLATHPQVTVLPRLPLSELKTVIHSARGAIGVDTGLSHLAGALGTPCVGLYGPTDHTLAGNTGLYQTQISTRRDGTPSKEPMFIGSASKDTQQVPEHLRMEKIEPEQAWQALQRLWESMPSPHETAQSH